MYKIYKENQELIDMVISILNTESIKKLMYDVTMTNFSNYKKIK